jgi:hypothetical protein
MAIAVSTDSAKRALLDRLIDDASLFPPASLAMRPALRAHARHKESAYWWMGGRFVLPASRLDEFAAARTGRDPIELSVVLDAGMQGARGDTVRADLERVELIRQLECISVASFEARLPRLTLDDTAIARIVADITERYPSGDIAFWYESSYDGGWAVEPDRWLATLAAARANAPANLTIGAKVRCGGAAPGATPSIDDLAIFMTAAHAHDVPWKATAGLHHPVRAVHGNLATHGFLNVFIAGIALHAGVIAAERVGEIIAELESGAFVVDPAHVAWRDVRLGAEQVAAARERAVALGSCSFDEPVNDLRELGMLL